ncbi:MAG TPA: hypothetical protein VFL29_04635, partial [Candidatus Dormibacteraeota bacterium]|nr:hypothetical protein [Candidatus Dormibacteraeota bacterium]
MGVSGLSLTGAFPPPAGGLGQFSLTVRVRDAYGAQQTDTANWYVFSHINFAVSSATCNGTYLTACSVRIPYVGGTPGGSPKVTVTNISCDPRYCAPPGNSIANLSLSASGGTVTFTEPAHCGFLAGSPACGGGWLGTVTIQLTDQSPCGPGNCTSGKLTVAVFIQAG